MTTRISLGFALLAATLFTVSVVGSLPAMPPQRPPVEVPAATDESPMESLDRSVQRRLHKHEGFGITRLADSILELHKFEPETPEESKVVAGLQEAGWTVGLYLGGRNLLAETDPAAPVARREVTGPIAVRPKKLPDDMPTPGDLRRIGRQALTSPDPSAPIRGTSGRWAVEARVVLADRKACLRCHVRGGMAELPIVDGEGKQPLKVGDALGVVIYTFAKDRVAVKSPTATAERPEIP